MQSLRFLLLASLVSSCSVPEKPAEVFVIPTGYTGAVTVIFGTEGMTHEGGPYVYFPDAEGIACAEHARPTGAYIKDELQVFDRDGNRLEWQRYATGAGIIWFSVGDSDRVSEYGDLANKALDRCRHSGPRYGPSE